MKQQSHSQSFTSQKGIYKISESEIENIDNIHVQEESVRVIVTLSPGWLAPCSAQAGPGVQKCCNIAVVGGVRRSEER